MRLARLASDESDRERLKAVAWRAQGVLRFEARVRSRGLRRGGIDVLTSITPERAASIQRGVFDEFGMGTAVVANPTFIRVIAGSDLSPAKQRGLIGYVQLSVAGLDPGVSRNTRSQYDDDLRTLGITLSSVALEQTLRLDFDSQQLVTGVAA